MNGFDMIISIILHKLNCVNAFHNLCWRYMQVVNFVLLLILYVLLLSYCLNVSNNMHHTFNDF
jgi:hypothetical protein